MEDLLISFAGNPVVQTALLFIGPFILEEAALLGGAALAASGELPPLVAFLALFLGIIVSDWLLYAAGALASRYARVRSFVGESNISFGRKMLQRGALAASITARLVPWLLLPIFLASGFLRTGFLRFAAVNAPIALIYAAVLFVALYQFDILLFEWLNEWAWIGVVVVFVLFIVAIRFVARRVMAGRTIDGRMIDDHAGGRPADEVRRAPRE
jgi:membrane protein DedA with SNARE-associated domain